ncbi:MAG: SDR family NAD(P)-dependent oxidoreductase [Alphaproteobacteria bacterium]|nr:SDR family NAD(P)-dependent oxidoreductase [Alphaproteobacteria bacterium]
MTDRNMSLAGRVAIVSGAAQGIGLAIARDLAACGARLVLVDPGTGIDGSGADPTLVQKAAEAIGDGAIALPISIAAPAAAAQAVELATKRFGGLDIVVNNAAILRDAFVFKLDPLDFEAVIRTNLLAAVWLTAAASPVLRDNAKAGRGGQPYGWGRIVNLVSTAGLYGNYGQAAYASAKAGLFGLTRVTALDLARSNVTANAVAPFAATRVTDSIRPANDAQVQYKARALKADPAHVARFVSFLCGAQGQSITGQLFGVRAREIFVFGQPRPAARAVAPAGDADDGAFAALVQAELAPHFAPLATDLESFNSEPVV